MTTFKLTLFIALSVISVKLIGQATYIPDDNFEQALIDLGYDTGELNDSVPTSNIKGITSLDISNRKITDLTGIKDFSALTKLVCRNNKLTNLDFSHNTALTYLNCNRNQLTRKNNMS